MAKSDYSIDGSYRRRSEPLETVAEVIDVLSQMPQDLPVACGFDGAVQVVWFNVGQPDEHASFQEGDGDEPDWELRQPS